MSVTNESQDENTTDALVHSVSTFRLVFLSLIVMTPILAPGMTSAYSSIALPQMHQLNMDESSWFGSITSIAWPFGSIFIGLIIDKFGRRISLLSGTIPSLVGWFLLADSNASLTRLYIGRALTGFALGACFLPSPVYVAECITINHTRIRSSIGTWTAFSMTIGCLIAYVFGAFLPHERVAFIAGLLSTLSLLLILTFIPESPAWLYSKGRIGDAEVAQLRLGIKQPILANRTNKVFPTFASASVPHANSWKNALHYVVQVRRPEVYKPLIVTITFLFFGEFSGLYCLQSYMVNVISVTSPKIDPYVISLVGQTLQIFACLFLTLTLPRNGVKTLSATSFVGISVGFIALALCEIFERFFSADDLFGYVSIGSIWTIMIAGQLGVLAIPYAVLGEMFPMGAKGFGSFSLFLDAIFNFIVLKIFPYVFAQYENIVFIVFSGICLCGAVFVVTCLPETVGKTMIEIENDFKQSKADGDGEALL